MRKLERRVLHATEKFYAHRHLTGASKSAPLRTLGRIHAGGKEPIGPSGHCASVQRLLLPGKREELVQALRTLAPDAERRTVAAAERACDHVFDLLGSGPVYLGEHIDWHCDFISGHRFEPNAFYSDVRAARYPGGFDIKVPWELSRCQHFVWLGQAYWFTDDERYAREFVAEVREWIANNPWPWGVNWACPMDVAIRAVNWLWGYAFFEGSPSLNDEFRLLFFGSLRRHGRHIARNIENLGTFPGNHYIADLTGLAYLGILCPQLREARKWREDSLGAIAQEMNRQVDPDGMHVECSTSYHRLVLEMLLSVTILARRAEHLFSSGYLRRLEKMTEFVMHVTQPDGTMPQIGDNDNGRLHRLKVWEPPEREWVDHRYLLAIGAVLFDRQDLAWAAGDQWEEATWLFGQESRTFRETAKDYRPSGQDSCIYCLPDAALCVSRAGNAYLLFRVGRSRDRGNGGHAHNDTMSIGIQTDGCDWLVDPGTFAYTANFEERNAFRSTSYHNTIVVDGRDHDAMERTSLFALPCRRPASLDAVQNTDDVSVFGAACWVPVDGESIEYRRRVLYDKRACLYVVRDTLTGASEHRIQWNWHLGMDVVVSRVSDGEALLRQGPYAFLLAVLDANADIQLATQSGWISRSYGTRVASLVVTATLERQLPAQVIWGLIPCSRSDGPADLVALASRWTHAQILSQATVS